MGRLSLSPLLRAIYGESWVISRMDRSSIVALVLQINSSVSLQKA